MTSEKFLSRGIDYLGDLGAKLGDLQGYRTLAHELIQNADDARATSMTFDVRDDELVVDNDGIFSDCGEIELAECPWKQDGTHDHRCDFHRFRYIASGDKRGQEGTTGAFGIGFIAVYQVTDAPELISRQRHWVLHEERSEDERITVCPGCASCTESDLPGTRFILPWARDPYSELRKALRSESVADEDPPRIVEELERSLPIAMLFLKSLANIEIRQSGRRIRAFERVGDETSLLLTDGNPAGDRIWYIVRGEFSQAADALRDRHPGRIEDKRSSLVTLAIPKDALRTGLLCACLPTEHDVGLPFHMNADFFPTNDRKRVLLGDDYQSDWNREALRAAARAIGDSLEDLPDSLGHQRFWNVVATLKEVADAAERGSGEPTLADFWTTVAPKLRSSAVIYTTNARWTTSAAASLLLQREEASSIPVLEALDLRVVHEDLRPYQNLLRSEAIGVSLLDIETLCRALASRGLTERVEFNDLPPFLSDASEREQLWGELALLLERHRNPKARDDDERRLKVIALAPGRDGAMWPCGSIYSADDATISLCEALRLDIPFISNDDGFAALAGLCATFDASAAISALRGVDEAALERIWQEDRRPLELLFEWFEKQREQILADKDIAQELARLRIFPSSEHLRALDQLALPGNFADPLGLAELIDLTVLGGRREFIRDLGMPELDFRTYAVLRLPPALRAATPMPRARRRMALVLLANRVGELRDDPEARRALASAPLIECADGTFRQASEAYFDTASVRECLGDSAHYVLASGEHKIAVRDLCVWLGVAEQPRLEDVAARVRQLSSQPYSSPIAEQLQKIVAHLGKRVDGRDGPPELRFLQNVQWLPARRRNDRWYRPSELYAGYQGYLFDSQALFVDVPQNVQNDSRPLLEFLGVGLTPPTHLVVKHLIHCATEEIPVNAEVYRFLSNNVGDPALVQLSGRECLLLGARYHAPSHVFWGEHPFGRYRWRLGEELRGYNVLLEKLGVRDAPDHHDALAVLGDISAEFGAANTPLDDEAYAVLASCWQMIEKAIDVGSALDELGALASVKCVPNVGRVLTPPSWLFFENRAGLAAKFNGFLAKNVIPLSAGGAKALAAAGVRTLGSAASVEILECIDPVDAPPMAGRIRGRANAIGRVLYSQSGAETAEALARLADIQCSSAASLVIQYRLRAFNRDLQSEPEQVPALYQPQQHTIFFTPRDGQSPWAAIARELAIALFPDQDPGRVAAGLKEVLAAETMSEATTILDELGFARIDTSVPAAPLTRETLGTLGTDTSLGDSTAMDQEEAATGSDGLNHDSMTAKQSPPPAAPAVSPEHDVDATQLAAASRPGGEQPRPPTQGKARPVLRSYVPAPSAVDSEATGQAGEHRSSVDRAGIQRVLAFEMSCGRTPMEMPHENPGYDIESRDSSGKVIRYIEVKSLSAEWSSPFSYAVLSRRQFEEAVDAADRFWLYVVERAETIDSRLYPIQNPILNANHFMFDDGWRAMAELTPPTTESS